MAYDLGTAHGTIEIDYDGDRAVAKAEKDMERLKRGSKDTDDHLKRLSQTLKGFGKGVGFAALATGAAQAAIGAANLGIQIAGMVPALASIGSLAAALPGAFVGGVAALGVLQASLAGVEDAVKAAFDTKHPEKFNEAIKNLSPSAQAFAKAVKGASGDLRTFQQGLQEAFFKSGDFAGLVPKVSKALNTLKPSLTGMASDFGSLGKQVADFALSSDSIAFFNRVLETFRNTLALIRPAIDPILTGLRAVGGVGLPLFERLGAAIGNVGTRFGEWMQKISDNGQLQSWIDTAIATLKTLGTIAQNIGGILQTVFQTAGQTGGGLLNTIAQITGQFNTFLKSAEGKAAITSLFTGIAAAASALSPVLTTVAGVLATALGPALQRLATEFGPVLLDVVQQLAPAIGPLATAFVDVVSAVSPLLPPLAQLVSMLVQLGAGVLSTIAQNLQPLATLFGETMTAALTQLTPVLSQVLAYLPQFATAGLQIAQALLPLVPAVIQFATALSEALLPYLPQIMQSVQQLIPPLVQLAGLFANSLAQALIAIIPYLPQIIGFMVAMQQTILNLMGAGLRFVTVVVQIGTALKSLVSTAVGAITAFAGAISSGINRAISFVTAFPRAVASALAGLAGLLVGIASRAWQALVSRFASGVSSAVGTARALPGRISGAVSSVVGILSGIASRAWNAFVSAVRSGVSNAASAASAVPGRIRSAVGNLGGLLVGAGRDALLGLARGISGSVGAAVSAAAAAGRAVISSVKSVLKIASPSREMIAIGRFVTQGLRNGLLGTAKQVQSAANRLANMVRDAFSDKLIKRGQRNSVLSTLSKGSKQLVGLVNRANSVAAKLKTAQTNLAAAQKAYNDQYNNAVKQTKESFQLVTNGQQFVNLDLTKERFKAAVAQAKQFATDIATLTKKGLNKDLIAQLAAAGADGGGAMARALAGADAATIKEFNSLQSQLNTAANSVGKTTADALYGAGLRAAQGIVKGLQSQQKAIEAQMLKIANSMVAAIKKALKIKSPSRIMFNLGQFTSEGLAEGIESLRRQVEQAAQKLATASIIPTVRLGLTGATSTAQNGAGGATTVGGTTNILNQTVNALPGMNAKQVADYSFAKLRYGLTTGVSSAPLPAPSPAGA